jgi:hypothetical protein
MTTSAKSSRSSDAFSLVEVLVSLGVLVFLILILTQLIGTATLVATSGSKHIDADSQARAVFDRMAADFAKMLKRKDIDYWVKQQGARYYPGHSAGHSQGTGHAKSVTQQGSDQIAFFSQVEGYYPSTGSPSPLALVSYRINTTTYQLERMGKGLLWNGVSNTNAPIVFLPLTIDQMWPAATNASTDADYEVIGPDAFRFEYYYLLKTNGHLSDNPWDTDTSLTPPHTAINGFQDVEAIGVAIAVIDPKSHVLLSDQNMTDLVANMIDFRNAPGRSGNSNGQHLTGDVEYQWGQAVINNTAKVPPAAAQAIRVYGRFFNLNVP